MITGLIILMALIPLACAEDFHVVSEGTKTTCNGNTCNLVINSNPDIRFTYLEKDKNYELKFIEFKNGNLTVDLNPVGIKVFPTNVPYKVWKETKTSSISNFKETYDKVVDQEITFNLFNQAERITISFDTKTIFEFGENSTTIILNTTNGAILDDADFRQWDTDYNDGAEGDIGFQNNSVRTDEGAIKFNISLIPEDVVIEEATMNLYMFQTAVESGEILEIGAYHTDKYWVEETVNWTNKPMPDNWGNPSDFVNFSDVTVTPHSYYSWNIIEAIGEETSGTNISFYLRAIGYECEISDYIFFYTKEYGTASLRPFLNITYTEEQQAQTNCTSYSGDGDWTIDCSTNCHINSTTDIGNNEFITENSGEIYVDENVTSISKWTISSGCKIVINNTRRFG